MKYQSSCLRMQKCKGYISKRPMSMEQTENNIAEISGPGEKPDVFPQEICTELEKNHIPGPYTFEAYCEYKGNLEYKTERNIFIVIVILFALTATVLMAPENLFKMIALAGILITLVIALIITAKQIKVRKLLVKYFRLVGGNCDSKKKLAPTRGIIGLICGIIIALGIFIAGMIMVENKYKELEVPMAWNFSETVDSNHGSSVRKSSSKKNGSSSKKSSSKKNTGPVQNDTSKKNESPTQSSSKKASKKETESTTATKHRYGDDDFDTFYYSDPYDFYYDHYDDFFDYEDAEEYFYNYWRK